ncbi:Panacea domain-containing protein [Novosphingobium rosa]|uniref:Panacea domain-containing protein n=1 Tax=Novosphingobium rosa TaxID=76978 RepID=UPI000AF28355|nr:type II toxin-antitoxin system antitoxin SocA domain-containing protein [Novosphingobium rosa]
MIKRSSVIELAWHRFRDSALAIRRIVSGADHRPLHVVIAAPSPLDVREMSNTIMPKRYSAIAIAKYFLAKQDVDGDDMITHLKLQKLCYYAQGVGIATRGEPMFDEPMEAWLHGPVVPALYREYRENGNNPLPAVIDLDENDYEPEDRMILDDVYTYYAQFSGWRLRQMTHGEAPWKDAYEQDMNRVITLPALVAFFKDEIEQDYSQRYVEISRRHAH